MKKNIIIIILVILSISLSGYIVYDKTNDENIKGETTNNTVNNEINKPLNSQFLSKFNGKYSYEKIRGEDICVATNEKPKEKINFELKTDGTFTYSYGLDCGGGFYINGNYYLGDNKIYLISDNCPFTSLDENSISHVNCHPVEEIYYSINNSNIELYLNDNNDKIIFEKN